MATLTVKLRTRIAWWVRPALAAVVICAAICPSRVEKLIDAIVDRGIKFDTHVS